MPTTLVGLLIFIVLLAPGFTSLLIAERGPRPGRSVSVLRETADIALSSLVFDLVALAAFGAVRTLAPSRTPEVGRLVRDAQSYFRERYLFLTWWGVSILLFACFLAILWAATLNSLGGILGLQARWPLRLLFPQGGVQFVSRGGRF
jgi:hypothetical protein